MSDLKLCKDCKHCDCTANFYDLDPKKDQELYLTMEDISYCLHPTLLKQHPVSGRIFSEKRCLEFRGTTAPCGSEAKLFEPRA